MINPFDEIKWGVLVCGPDDALAAQSFEQAVEKSNEINQAMIKYKNSDLISEYDPICFAVVGIWETICEANHEPDKTDWLIYG